MGILIKLFESMYTFSELPFLLEVSGDVSSF